LGIFDGARYRAIEELGLSKDRKVRIDGDKDLAMYQTMVDRERVEKEKIERIRKRLKLSKSQYLYPETGRVSVKDWEETMDRDETAWCMEMIRRELNDGDYYCVDSFRAARAWKSSQVRRFKKLRT